MINQKIIVVFCHSRANLLEMCLNSIKNANNFDSWKLIVIQQKEFNKVDTVLKKYKNIISLLVSLDKKFDFPLGNINYNRVLGTRLAFEMLSAKCMLGIEEDNVISKNSLIFIEQILLKYGKSRNFRGINLGSVESGKDISKDGYSLLRYGLHGSAGVLTDKSWNHIQRKKLFSFDFNNSNIAWDGEIEFYLKSGFMVTPNLSMNLDLGVGGTFAPKNPNDIYFAAIKRSWLQNSSVSRVNYQLKQINHNWRHDAIGYKRIHNVFYYFRKFRLTNKITKKIGINKLIVKYLAS